MTVVRIWPVNRVRTDGYIRIGPIRVGVICFDFFFHGFGKREKKNTKGVRRTTTHVHNGFRQTTRVIAGTIHIKYRRSYPGRTRRYKLSFVAATSRGDTILDPPQQ